MICVIIFSDAVKFNTEISTTEAFLYFFLEMTEYLKTDFYDEQIYLVL